MTRDLTQLNSDLTELQTSTRLNIARIDFIISINSIASDIIQQMNSAEFKKIKKTHEDFRTAQDEKLKTITAGVTGVTLALTILKVDFALFKVDEHGITIFGVTRPWTKDANKELIEKNRAHIENLKETVETVNEIKRRLTAASAASTQERSRLEADPKKRTDRGIDASRPIVRGVASDVTVLRAALNELTKAF